MLDYLDRGRVSGRQVPFLQVMGCSHIRRTNLSCHGVVLAPLSYLMGEGCMRKKRRYDHE